MQTSIPRIQAKLPSALFGYSKDLSELDWFHTEAVSQAYGMDRKNHHRMSITKGLYQKFCTNKADKTYHNEETTFCKEILFGT